MDAAALAALEYPAIVERLARAAGTPQGASAALALAPSGEPAEVARRQRLTGEAIALLDAACAPDLAGVVDIREAEKRAARGSMLSPHALRELEVSIRVALEARSVLDEQRRLAPTLCQRATAIEPSLAATAEAIGGCVEEDGSGLRDAASPRLRSLRAELQGGRQRVIGELGKLARRSELRQHLQEEFVTERGGRPVLAVKAAERHGVPGIVHDASSSGQTLFVEPFAIVELNNRLSEVAGAEREEVERILRELSALVGDRAPALEALVGAIAEIDLALACGALSRRWGGAPVEIAEAVRLLGARHPLLDPASAVPIDLDLGDLRVLVVSGPNAGGKTVALKTLGLAALLHQSGLRPPALRASLPVFDRVLADIGDPQSIEMSLSTFSGHVGTLVAILGAAGGRSLVLLDELAGGTDPVEGSALAQALVARLARQARLTVVTTHHPELKEWASATEGVVNAATGFDPETQEPLFTLSLGRPGTSHALRIAERLGLDPLLVADARTRIAPERLQIGELLAEAEAAAGQARDALAESERQRGEAERQLELVRARERELATEIAAVQASAQQVREQALAAAERDLTAARSELRALRDEIRAAERRERERRRGTPAAGEAGRERDRRLGQASRRAGRAEQALRRLEPLPVLQPLAAGDPVEAPELGVVGTIATVEGDEAEVIGPGGLRVRVPLTRLRPGRQRHSETEAAAPAVRVSASARSDVGDELDVRGRRAQEAREAVRRFVDDAALAGLPSVRVVHGRGTGAVRAAVRDELDRHPLVASQEADSADGATVARLGS